MHYKLLVEGVLRILDKIPLFLFLRVPLKEIKRCHTLKICLQEKVFDGVDVYHP